jgi:molecular chaperone DnaK
VKDAQAHAAEDKKKRELVDARNGAEAAVHQVEKSLGEHGDKISAEDKSAIEAALGELKSAKDGEDAAAIQQKTEKLLQAAMKLGEAMYKAEQEKAAAQGGAAKPDAAAGAPNKKDETVVDAQFEEVDEKKKKK